MNKNKKLISKLLIFVFSFITVHVTHPMKKSPSDYSFQKIDTAKEETLQTEEDASDTDDENYYSETESDSDDDVSWHYYPDEDSDSESEYKPQPEVKKHSVKKTTMERNESSFHHKLFPALKKRKQAESSESFGESYFPVTQTKVSLNDKGKDKEINYESSSTNTSVSEEENETTQAKTHKQNYAAKKIETFIWALKTLQANILKCDYDEIDQERLKKRSVNDLKRTFTIIKRKADRETKTFVKGDLHGDSVAIDQIKNYLKQTDLAIELGDKFFFNGNVNLIFLGDYSDRGDDSIETWIKLAKLKNDNPYSVILLRGNHDDPEYLLNNTSQDPKTLLNEIKNTINLAYPNNKQKKLLNFNEIINRLAAIFSILPQILFVGYEEEVQGKKVDYYLMFTHAGIPVEEYIALSRRPQNNFIQEENFAKFTNSIKKFLKNENEESLIEENIDFPIHTSKYGTFVNPFLWNDFTTENNKITQQSQSRGDESTILEIGTLDTKNWLEKISTKKAEVAQIIRGHQQNNRQLFQGLGIAPQCENKVLTLDVSPNVEAFYDHHQKAMKELPLNQRTKFVQTLSLLEQNKQYPQPISIYTIDIE